VERGHRVRDHILNQVGRRDYARPALQALRHGGEPGPESSVHQEAVDPELTGRAFSCSGGSTQAISRSSKPRASSVPANDSSTMKTTR
jgi:hypothetical protein